MGAVFYATDSETEQPVAVKLLHPGQAGERFLREARVLSTLEHPAIVRYVAHGETPEGQRYLAMEWLEGSTLSSLLSHRKLSASETWALAQRVAAGLAAAHEQGIVHRDIKPSNIFVPGGELSEAKVIDFGVARRQYDPHFTEVGLLIGTLSYMSPEQAGGERNPEPCSDIFSLGSLLYRCLTGENPFLGGDATAVLAKILLEQPTTLRELVPSTPVGLELLITEMLSKSKNERPENGGALLERLEALSGEVLHSRGPAAPHLGSTEQRAVWVLLVGGGRPEDTETREIRISQPELDPSLRVAAQVIELGGSWNTLADGSVVASFVDTGDARGTRALRAAQTLRQQLTQRPMSLCLGLGVMGERAPLGSALDRAARELLRADASEVALDDETAKALGGDHAERTSRGRFRLSMAAPDREGKRRFLGRETPCVGRQREMAALHALADECFEEPVARAVIAVGEAGLGKSRIRYEFLKELRREHPNLQILFGRADALSAGSPFGPLRSALRRSAGIMEGEPAADSRVKLMARARTALGSTRLALDAALFLGELANVPFDDSDSPALRAARAEPTLLGDAIRGAWLDFIEGASKSGPIAIVLEDMHWGDRPTVSLIDATLATHTERPVLVFALARPEVFELFPKLWAARGAQEVRLPPLHKKASVRLVRNVLEDITEEQLSRVVDLADGNAFFLEELIRAVSEGQTELPATVVGVVQARLEQLSPSARRVLRGASILGARFWRGAVAQLIGSEVDHQALKADLNDLVARELCSERAEASFPGEDEYIFRHAVVRETAYASLTADDRKLGHRIAGRWLREHGESDDLVLAEHFRRGDSSKEAALHYAAAAGQALEGHDLVATLDRVELALTQTPDDRTRGELERLRAHAQLWQGKYALSEQAAMKAQALLESGSERWFAALSDLCSSAGSLDHDGTISEAASVALSAKPGTDGQRTAQVMCLARAVTAHLKSGHRDRAHELLERLEELVPRVKTNAAGARAWRHHARSAVAYFAGKPAQFRRELELAVEQFDLAGDARTSTNDRVNLGFVLITLGQLDRAEELLLQVLSAATRLGLETVKTYSRHNLGLVRLWLGDAKGSVDYQRVAVNQAVEQGEAILEGSARAYLSLALVELGQKDLALEEAERAKELLTAVPGLLPLAVAVVARALLSKGRVPEACSQSENAAELLEKHGCPEDTEALVHVTWAEANLQLGDEDKAREIVRTALTRLLERADALEDDAVREGFMTRVPSHKRTTELAEQLGLNG